jgi:membrane protein
VLQDWLVDRLGWSGAFSVSFAVFRWVVICLALLAAFALVYRIGPNTERPFRMFRLGNVIATAGFLVASFGFRVYVTNFASYDAMYGSLGAAIVLLLWLFIVGWVVLVGGEINALREDRQTTKASAARSERASTLAMHRGGTHDSATY